MKTPQPAERTGADWTAQRERSNLPMLRLMRNVALFLGRPLTRWLLHPIALWFVLFSPEQRRHARVYLDRVFALSGRRARWIDGYHQVHAFASTVLDRVYLLQGRFDLFEIEAHGVAAILDPFHRGEGVLACGAHVGSFEALRTIGHDEGLRVAMIMYEDNARLINDTLAAMLPPERRGELVTIGLGRLDAMLTLRRWLDDGGVAGMLADRTLPGSTARGKGVVVDFLGAPAVFGDGPFRLAALLRRKVVFMAGLYRGGNRYELRFGDLADFSAVMTPAERDLAVRAAVERYARTLEGWCRDAPYNWFNFFDFWAGGAEAAAALQPAAAPRETAAPPAATPRIDEAA